jgi:hypothetical protein
MNTRICARMILAALLAVLTLASFAWADCAWVVWSSSISTSGAEVWSVIGAYSRESGGENACGKFTKEANDRSKGEQNRLAYVCLPDTVDPRGPKGRER